MARNATDWESRSFDRGTLAAFVGAIVMAVTATFSADRWLADRVATRVDPIDDQLESTAGEVDALRTSIDEQRRRFVLLERDVEILEERIDELNTEVEE